MTDSFAGEVWKTLNAINVGEHIEKKANLSYLSWAWAWQTLMEHYPESAYSFSLETHQDGGVTVFCRLAVSEGERTLCREMWLPVMDNRNNAIVHPDARKISDTKMRCLVKCMAMFGLGHYIYAGEDLPQEDKRGYTDDQLEIFTDLLDGDSDRQFAAFMATLGHDTQTALFNSFPKGAKVKEKQRVRDKEEAGNHSLHALVENLHIAANNGDIDMAQEERAGMDDWVARWVKKNAPQEVTQFLIEIAAKRAAA